MTPSDQSNLSAHGLPAMRRRPVFLLLPRQFLCLLIQLYRQLLSPAQTFLFGAQTGCRFTPTCSRYAMEAIREHGAAAGSVLAFKRVCRCNPFAECGHDPVPPATLTLTPLERGLDPR